MLSGGCLVGGMMIQCDDVLVHVGDKARITARLSLSAIPRLGFTRRGKVIRFRIDGQSIGEVTTGRYGSATLTYSPREEREYRVVVTCEGGGRSVVASAEATLFSRSARRQAIILDLDRTLSTASILGTILKKNRNIPPLKDAVAVTNALSREYDLIIITGRKTYIRKRTKKWLKEQGFPRLPVYFSPPRESSLTHERFKTDLIRDLKRVWENIVAGIGDRDSDARAYLSNGLRTIILREKGRCPPGATVVSDWETIRDLLLA
jgi:hypothetical protein